MASEGIIALGFSLLIVVIFGRIVYSYYDSYTIEKKDFNEYYGISPEINYFITNKTENCNSSVIFKPAFPSRILERYNSPMSFLLLAQYGSGKSLLKCLYLNSIQSSTYMTVLISTQQLDEYLTRFVTETSIVGFIHEKENYLIGWSKNEFAQIILSASVTQFVNLFSKKQFKFLSMPLDEKLDLLMIICYYYNDLSINTLEIFVNSFLDKSLTSSYRISKIKDDSDEDDDYEDNTLLTHFERDLKKLTTISQNPHKLKLLLDIFEGEDYHDSVNNKITPETVFQSLTQFTQFMKNQMKIPVLFVIDGLDENQYFFHEQTVDKLSLELFYRSSFSLEILSSVMAKNFYVALFYPQVDDINVEEPVYRGEQLSTYRMDWNTELLINYADYLIEHMNKRASSNRTEAIPNFKTFINYDKSDIATIISRIPTPRAFHLFMTELIQQFGNLPHQVTSYEVKTAFEKSYENFYNRYI